jgi:hypothetical protein
MDTSKIGIIAMHQPQLQPGLQLSFALRLTFISRH